MKPPKGGETQKRSRYITRRKCCVPSIFAFGKNLDAGRIYSARADKINRVEPPRAPEPKKKDRKDFIFPVLLFGADGGTRTRTSNWTLAPQASQSTSSSTSAKVRPNERPLDYYSGTGRICQLDLFAFFPPVPKLSFGSPLPCICPAFFV